MAGDPLKPTVDLDAPFHIGGNIKDWEDHDHCDENSKKK